MEELLGIYKALVTDTECFQETGKIKTRISVMNNFHIGKDIRDNYDINVFKKKLENDLYTQIFMPFGGGYDYGMFKLPPVNSLGLVSFIDGNPDKPVWLGGLSNSIYTRTGVLHTSTAPSDDPFSGESIITFDENENKGKVNNEDLNSLVIKTKNNSFTDLNNPEEINWEKRNVENAIVLNKNRMSLSHTNEEEEYQSITLSKEETEEDTFSIKITDERNNYDNSTIKIGESGIRIEVVKNNLVSKIEMGDNEIILTMKKGEKETVVSQTEKEIRLRNDKSSVALKKEGARDEVIISSQRVRISADDILMGNGDYKVVVSPASFNISLEDGTMLTTANNVRI